MAAGLAAAIESAFGITATLVEGHDGIYLVAVGDETAYDSRSTCSNGFPRHEEILVEIARITGLDFQSPALEPFPGTADRGPACTWPPPPAFEVLEPSSDCGCSDPGIPGEGKEECTDPRDPTPND